MKRPSKTELIRLHSERTGDKRDPNRQRIAAEAEEEWLARNGRRIAAARSHIQNGGIGAAVDWNEGFMYAILDDEPFEYSTKRALDRLNEIEQDSLRTINLARERAEVIELEQLENGYRIWREMQDKPKRNKDFSARRKRL